MNFSIELAKRSFFSAASVLRRLDKAEARVLRRQGAYVRTVARNSMRRRNRKSRPGETPTVRSGLLRQHIYFVWSEAARTVIVGPAAFSRNTGAPSALEFGGTSRMKANSKTIVAEIEARPYMGPALTKSMPAFPGMWADSLSQVR